MPVPFQLCGLFLSPSDVSLVDPRAKAKRRITPVAARELVWPSRPG
jgi:hypothetical protein